MANICPLLIRASFVGRTYHDFELEFQSPSINCTVDPEQNPILIQFNRILNSTFNESVYTLYDPTRTQNQLAELQVFHNDHVNLCLRPALQPDKTHVTCHEFYMITMLSSMNSTLWPLLIIFGYIIVLLIAIGFSLLTQVVKKLSRTLFSGSITKKIIKHRNVRSLSPLTRRQTDNIRLKKLNEKKQLLKTIDLIANEYQPNQNTFIIQTNKPIGHINRAYV